MARVHVIKLTESDAVLKCYVNDSAGGTIDISLSNLLTRQNEVYVPNESKASIRSIYFGAKKDKQIDITRIVPTTPQFPGDTEYDASGVHNHYFLTNSGVYEFKGFADTTYSSKDIRIIGDGPFHVIIVLGKTGWLNKIETAQFSIYDDTTQVGQ